jgi:hypothetical protein
MDLRREFDNILKNYGHNILLQRDSNSLVPGKTPDYGHVLEMHTVRHVYPNSNSLGFVQQEHIEGLNYDVDVVYYFRHDANPDPGDRVYDNIESFPNGSIIFTIDWAAPMRGRGGQIVFWAAGCTKQIPN